MIVAPEYIAISTVVEIAKPWIQFWGGDEWGDSMSSLAQACVTDYGFSDEDCALFAWRLWENLMQQKEWIDADNQEHDWEPEGVAWAQKKCREERAYWLNGGNLSGFSNSEQIAADTVAQMPGWVFGE